LELHGAGQSPGALVAKASKAEKVRMRNCRNRGEKQQKKGHVTVTNDANKVV
jgi:hypothetical protein